MFETLLSKTLFILAISLGFCFLGALGVVNYFRRAYEKGASYVIAETNEQGQLDLKVSPDLIVKIFWPALILNIITFIVLMFYQNVAPLNFFLMSLLTFTDGITIGIVLLCIDENIGIKVTALTAIATLLTSLIGMYSGIDFSFLGKFLFFALLGLIIISIIRIFVSIKGFHRKVIASIGILIFIGYLLYDFNNLDKAKNIAKLNNWNTALDFSVNIYLDIINLFMQILDLLSD
ncbi:MAG: Bax inhibitor-1 family protein [Candidatus Gastranaerophilales bacterium]|nr:Bax inhibitor-1 family protein [Candidatus Gastranaerophilales bacterium]